MFLAGCQKSEPDWHKQASSLRYQEISLATTHKYLGRDDGCLSNSAPKSTDSGDVTTNGESVDIMRAFVGGNRLKVHEMSDHRITIGDAHGAEEVARFTRAFQRHPDVVALRQ